MRVLVIALSLLHLCSCMPVATVVMRDATVLPKGERVKPRLWGIEGQVATDPDNGEWGSGRGTGIYSEYITRGVGNNCDWTLGFSNLQGFIGARYQFIGMPGMTTGTAMSCEIGGSAMMGPADPIIVSDIYSGLNVSYGFGTRSFYCSYRHHWVSNLGFPWRQNALFIGVNRGGTAGWEVFHTWSANSNTSDYIIDSWGLNVSLPLK